MKEKICVLFCYRFFFRKVVAVYPSLVREEHSEQSSVKNPSRILDILLFQYRD